MNINMNNAVHNPQRSKVPVHNAAREPTLPSHKQTSTRNANHNVNWSSQVGG